jgi:cysteine desulfurase
MNGHPALRSEVVYLDYNATTPVDPRVAGAAAPYLTGGPSHEIVFTGSGSEANLLAIRGTLPASGRRRHVITQVTEHPAVSLGRWSTSSDIQTAADAIIKAAQA